MNVHRVKIFSNGYLKKKEKEEEIVLVSTDEFPSLLQGVRLKGLRQERSQELHREETVSALPLVSVDQQPKWLQDLKVSRRSAQH